MPDIRDVREWYVPCKKEVLQHRQISSNAAIIKFHNTFWAAFGFKRPLGEPPRVHLAAKRCLGFVVEFNNLNNYNITGH